MTLTLQPVRIATGFEEEGMLVFDDEQRLVAIPTHLSDQYDGASGHWFLEAGFGRLEGKDHPTFADPPGAEAWLNRSLAVRL